MTDERNERKADPTRRRTRTRATRGRGNSGSGRDRRKSQDRDRDHSDAGLTDHSDSDRTDISLVIRSRFPELTDYDRTSHAYKKSYVHPNGYPIGVTACKGLITTDPGEIDLDPPVDTPRDPGRGDDPPDGPVHPLGQQRRKEIPQRVPDDIVAWRWRLERSDGEVVDRARHRANVGPEACQARLIAPEPGQYRVHLTLELTDGEQTASRSFQIPRERLIVSIGDSYASGEGVPDRSSHHNPVWVEPKAHRSFRAGPALAAKAFENTIDGDLVTFLSFATSGAEIDKGLLGRQHDWQGVGQLEEVERAVGDRSIDALLVSIGGNDVHFAGGIKGLALDPPWPLSMASEIEEDVKEAIDELAEKYDELAKRIERLDPEHVFITEYPIAHFDIDDDGAVEGGCGVLETISTSDAEMIKRLGERLNETIEKAAEEHDWTYIDGIVEGFRGHGYCSDERYFVTASQSNRGQGDYKGILHPNRAGHRVYADQIVADLRREIGDRRGGTGGRGGTDREPIVRDHREDPNDRSDRDQGPKKRDHRTDRDDRRDSDRRSKTPPRGGGRSDRGTDDRRGNVHRK